MRSRAGRQHHHISGETFTELVRTPQMQELMTRYVDELNGQLHRWETIKKWAILDHDLTVESGELTPSMKVKRKVVESNYKYILDGFYA